MATTFNELASIWLSGSRANDGGAQDADWDLVVFGNRQAAEALEASGSFLGQDVDVVFVDLASGEFKRLWKSEIWEDFASWCWIERSATEAEYHSAKFSDQLVMMGGEWVEAGALAVTRKRALRLWPTLAPETEAATAVN
ncbi:MAG TPA: nucleotidyltransferase domain-containing protein [Thermoanaerobaculia bacterium]|nr:nucleotidyltransferase domain-containing protein [Thermoanaerobaculia bacterium]